MEYNGPDDVGLGAFEGMYDEDDPEPIKPEWVVRVGREEDKDGYSYLFQDGVIHSVGDLIKDPAKAQVFPDEKRAWEVAMRYTHGHAFDRNGVAKEEKGYLRVLQATMVEEKLCVSVPCQDVAHFLSLPDAVTFRGVLLGKTGWNSDTGRAHYQENTRLVKQASAVVSLHQFYAGVQERAKKTRERYGQALFNHLYEVRPALAQRVQNSDKDPFYATSGDRINRFVLFIETEWYK